MNIVVYTNRIIAALIKDGVSRRILSDKRFEFVTPEYSLSEISVYEQVIRKKAKLAHEEFGILFSLIFEYIEIIPLSEYAFFIEETKKLIEDMDDVPFLALALSVKADGIWSDDAHFTAQDKIRIFKTKEMDEPIDSVIYMLTAALGFVALENAFFLISPLSQGNFIESIITGNLRFMGASLLHIISSTTIGIFIALSFYKKKVMKIEYLAIGMILAIILHTIFNLLIIDSTNTTTFTIFAVVWIAVIVLLLFFEKIKKIIPNK